MRNDLHEMADSFMAAASRRDRTASRGFASSLTAVELEPLAVDAAFADESLPMLKDRTSRRDRSHLMAEGGGSMGVPSTLSSDDALLRSLSTQLELLNEQQREI